MTCTFHGDYHNDGELITHLPMVDPLDDGDATQSAQATHRQLTLASLDERSVTSLIRNYNPACGGLIPASIWDNEAKPATPAQSQGFAARYPGSCTTCKGPIQVGERILGGPWRHVTCPAVLPLAPAVIPDQVLPSTATVTPIDVRPKDGRYTAVLSDHHRTLRLRTNGPDWDFAPNEQVVHYLNGCDNDTSYQACGILKADGTLTLWKKHRGTPFEVEIKRAVAAILEDPSVAGEAYALRSGRCCRCGRTLTVPASIHRGMGPECASK